MPLACLNLLPIHFTFQVVNNEDDSGYCLVHASLNIQQGKLNPSHCKLLYTYTQVCISTYVNHSCSYCYLFSTLEKQVTGFLAQNMSGTNPFPYFSHQNELHEFCQNLLDRIEAKSGKKGNFSSNNSDSGSSASTSTKH